MAEKKQDYPPATKESEPEEPSTTELKVELAAAREQIQQLLQAGQEKEQELARQKDLYLRALAEMENLKKRTAKEKEEFAKYSQESLLLNILPVVDNLERALEAAKNHQEAQDPSALQAGVTLILKQFLDILEKLGVKPLEAGGQPFDPHFHHAVMNVETSEAPAGTVVEILQKGYLLKDRLLRPAMVKVAASPREK